MEIWAPQLTFTPDYFKENESWVAMDEEGPMAFYTLLNHKGIAWVENLFVMPEFMGLGIGRQLFRHSVEIARTRGYAKLQLEADPNAIGFYERMGMHKIGERHSEVDGQPRVLPIMEINLL
jgi:ribosomal protein S18 acetylase RimI-like enzyme